MQRTKSPTVETDDVGDRIIAACVSAGAIEVARQENGIPPTIPAPWPASTWAYQSQWTKTHYAS